MQRKEGLPSARGQRKKGDRLCHVITPRDKARALKKSTKKRAPRMRGGNFLQKTRRYKTGDEKKSGSREKKRNYAPGANAEKRRGEG